MFSRRSDVIVERLRTSTRIPAPRRSVDRSPLAARAVSVQDDEARPSVQTRSQASPDTGRVGAPLTAPCCAPRSPRNNTLPHRGRQPRHAPTPLINSPALPPPQATVAILRHDKALPPNPYRAPRLKRNHPTALLGKGAAFDRLSQSGKRCRLTTRLLTVSANTTIPGCWSHGLSRAAAKTISILDQVPADQTLWASKTNCCTRSVPTCLPVMNSMEATLPGDTESSMISGRDEPTIETAGVAIDCCLPNSVENRLGALTIRTKVRATDDERGVSEGDTTDIVVELAEPGRCGRNFFRS